MSTFMRKRAEKKTLQQKIRRKYKHKAFFPFMIQKPTHCNGQHYSVWPLQCALQNYQYSVNVLKRFKLFFNFH